MPSLRRTAIFPSPCGRNREPARLADLQLKTTQTNATIPFVLDGQVLEDNLHWCGKNHAWLERTAEANTLS